MKIAAFLLRYFRRSWSWALVALTAALIYGASAAVIISLVEPIFGEVLLAGDSTPGFIQMGDSADTTEAAGNEESGELTGRARSVINALDIKAHIDRGYENLKRALNINDRTVVFFVPILVVTIFLLRSFANFVSSYSFQRIGLSVTNEIRNDLYRQILTQSSRFHAEHSSGELISRVVSDVGLMQTAVSYRVVDLVQQSLTLIFLLAVLLSTHFRLAMLCVVVLPIFVFPIVRFGAGMRKTSHRSQERMADLAALVGEGVRGHRVVKAFGMEEFEFTRFRAATRRHLRVNLWAQMLSSLSSPVIESLGVIGIAALLIWAGLRIREGDMSAPVFIGFLINLFWLYEPIRKLNKVNLVLQQSLAAVGRVYDIMQIPNEIVEVENPVVLEGVEREIGFEGVEFGYEEANVLHGIDLTIHKGEVVALVGPSGAGKSTLINLLPRFFDPDEGRLTIDGIDVRAATLDSLRALIGIVTQDTVLFDDTIGKNIAYGRHDLPLERIRQAAEAAYADEFIMETPKGYDTAIGEAGVRLSGGQKQRLAIARALLKDAPLLILDEATSQLDTASESLVQKALANLMEGRTTLVIAHRLSTVMNADRIVVMEGGRIVEQGVHSELLEFGGLYKRLYDLQFDT